MAAHMVLFEFLILTADILVMAVTYFSSDITSGLPAWLFWASVVVFVVIVLGVTVRYAIRFGRWQAARQAPATPRALGDGGSLAPSLRNIADETAGYPDLRVADSPMALGWLADETDRKKLIGLLVAGRIGAWARPIRLDDEDGEPDLMPLSNEVWATNRIEFRPQEGEGTKNQTYLKVRGTRYASTHYDIHLNLSEVSVYWPQKGQRASAEQPKLPTWDELGARFAQMEPALQFSRIDGQTGADGEYWRIAGPPARDAEEKFKAAARLASARLSQDFPREVAKHPELLSEGNAVIRWYKALRYIGDRYESGGYGEQTNEDGSSGGFIFIGTIHHPAAASEALCLTLASWHLTSNGEG